MPILLNKTLRLFLDSIGRREEYEFYLKKFQTGASPAFALLCPERSEFESAASVFSFDLDFLLKLELRPVVLLCGDTAEEMRTVLMREEHPYADFTITENSGIDGSAINEFLADCRQNNRVGILVAPHLSREAALLEMVPGIARRVHIIRMMGPLRDEKGQRINYVYIARHNVQLMQPEDQDIVRLAARLLEKAPGVHLSVASPLDLLQELFTVKGAGCVIRRGSRIRCLQDGQDVDKKKLAALLEDSFGKKLRDDCCLERATFFYLEENYRGAAILERHEAGDYLSKFAVGTQARGEGLAQELWKSIIDGHDKLFWRAREGNVIIPWYEKQADGYHKEGAWRVFWRGIEWPHIPDIIRYSLERDEDFV